jgi:hypothetical protein
MTDLSFIAAFANNPITLAILLIGATVIVFIVKGQPFIKGMFGGINEKIDAIIESDKTQSVIIDEIKENVRHNYTDLLRITIYNTAIDIEDRLVAAKRYFVRGGNGKVAEYVSTLVAEHPDVWKVILAMSSEDDKKFFPEELK